MPIHAYSLLEPRIGQPNLHRSIAHCPGEIAPEHGLEQQLGAVLIVKAPARRFVLEEGQQHRSFNAEDTRSITTSPCARRCSVPTKFMGSLVMLDKETSRRSGAG